MTKGLRSYPQSKAASEAGEILGVRTAQVLFMPDNRMDLIDMLDEVRVFECEIEMINPKMVVKHHAGDVNIDNQLSMRQ